MTNEGREKIRLSRLGKKHSKETCEKIRVSRIGTKSSEETKMRVKLNHKGMIGKNHSDKTKEKISNSKKGKIPWNKGIHQIKTTGENHPNWQGGKTNKLKKLRNSIEYKLWRKAIFERDNYTCVWCGDNHGGNLQADHIKPFAHYPELRFALDNGRTLCIPCHKTTDTYLSKGLKKKTFAD